MESPVVHCFQGSISLTLELRVFLSRDELDMFLLGSIAATVCDNDNVGVRSGHKSAKRHRKAMDYIHKGLHHICRNTFTFLQELANTKCEP